MPSPPVDRPLDADRVAALIAARFPEVTGTPERIGSGWDNEMYRVGEWLFRFPRTADIAPWLERELLVQPHLLRAVAPVPMPEYTLVSGAVEGLFPYTFVGYRPIPGVDLNAAERLSPDLPGDLGAMLSRLHAVDPALVPPPPKFRERSDWQRLADALVRDAETIRPRVPEPALRDAEAFLAGAAPPPPFAGPPRVLHNDLYGSHVLVDPASGALTGVIDWTDMGVGDPVVDFLELVAVDGYAFTDAMLASYTLPRDPRFDERLRWASRAMSLYWLDKADPGDLRHHLRWLLRAFEVESGA